MLGPTPMSKDQKDKQLLNQASRKVGRRAFLGESAYLGLSAAAAVPLVGCTPEEPAPGSLDLRFIGLEEHFSTPEMQELNGIKFPKGAPAFDINDVGAGRIAHMDKAGLDVQVLSCLTAGAQNLPGDQGIQYAQKVNNWIAKDVVSAYPDRFRAFATVALTNPEAAADELERAVRDLGFLGCMTYGSIIGKFLDDPIFDPFLARAEALNVPIYIHPAAPSPEIAKLYYSDLGSNFLNLVMAGPGYGWHQEVALQSLRMIARGVFDKYPKLQVIVGHMGEGLPFYYWRFAADLTKATKKTLAKPFQQYLHDNFWITTSAFFQEELLTLALASFGEDRMMFATDYPFVDASEGTQWFKALDLPQATKEKIAFRNAETLLKINPA